MKVSYSAVGILYFFIISFANSLLPSTFAASLDGPNTFRPFFSNSSTIPIVNGISGPTTVKSILFCIANSLSPSIFSTLMLIFLPYLEVPPFPGAINISLTLLDFDNFHAIVSSLPPLPTISTFIFSKNHLSSSF